MPRRMIGYLSEWGPAVAFLTADAYGYILFIEQEILRHFFPQIDIACHSERSEESNITLEQNTSP